LNYTSFVKLHDKFGARGLRILAFPCNQFGGQEPGDHDTIMKNIAKYGVEGKIEFLEKANVNGPNAREVFTFLKEKVDVDGKPGGPILWNFTKFLVDHKGTPVKRVGPKVDPADLEFVIEELLIEMEAAQK